MRAELASLPPEPKSGAFASAWLQRPVPRTVDLSWVPGPAAALRGIAVTIRDATADRSVTLGDLKASARIALELVATARASEVVGDAGQQALDAGRAWRAIGASLHRTVDGANESAAVSHAVEDASRELPEMDAASFALAARELPGLAAAVSGALALHAEDHEPGGRSVLLMARTRMAAEDWNLLKLNDRTLVDRDRPFVPVSTDHRLELAQFGREAVGASRELRDQLNPVEIVGLGRALAATALLFPTPSHAPGVGTGRPIDGPSR